MRISCRRYLPEPRRTLRDQRNKKAIVDLERIPSLLGSDRGPLNPPLGFQWSCTERPDTCAGPHAPAPVTVHPLH